MDTRKVIAIIEVDADTAFKAIDDGPIPYLEQAVPKIDGVIGLGDAFISDDDEDDIRQRYLNYVAEWVFEHLGDDENNDSPLSYEDWMSPIDNTHAEADVPSTDNAALVCKRCGHKQSDEDTINTLRSRFPSMETHDIPYYCGACMGCANDDERAEMEQKMSGLSDPQIAGADVSNIRELIYERYKLHWMATHGYSLIDLMKELKALSIENADDSVTSVYIEWELLYGFGGAIWPGQSEFFANEYKEPAVISPLLYTTEERLAYLEDVATLRKGDWLE